MLKNGRREKILVPLNSGRPCASSGSKIFSKFPKIKKYLLGYLAAFPDKNEQSQNFKNAINQKVEEIFQIRRHQWTRGVPIDLENMSKLNHES